MRPYLAILFFFISFSILGQIDKMDSLKITELIKESENEPDTLKRLLKYRKALKLSKELKFDYGIFFSHQKIADWKHVRYNTDSTIAQYKSGIKDLSTSSVYRYNLNQLIGVKFQEEGKFDSALYYFKKDLTINSRSDVTGLAYMRIGNMWFQKYDYSNAFESYAKADSIFERDPKFKISKQRAQINNYLGYCVRTTHGNEKALEYYNISKQLHKDLNNTSGVQEINIAIAQAEISFGNHDTALNLLNESIEFHETHAKEKNSYSYGVIVRGFLLAKMKKFKEAEKDYMLYKDLAKISKNKTYQRRALAYLGDFYANSNQFQKSISHYLQAIEKCRETNDLEKELETTKSLIEVYKASNQIEPALDAYEDYIVLKEKIDKKNITEKTLELEAEFQTEKKEQEIILLQAQNANVEQQKKNQRNLLLAGLGITTLAGLFLFFLFRNRQKTNNKLKDLDKLKTNFFANISHEFRTPLTLISSPIDDVLTDDTISEKKRQQFTIAKQNSDRLLNLVNQLLDLSKIDAGHLKLHIQKGDVLQLIAALSESFRYHAKQKSIEYHVAIKPSDEEVWFDKDAVEKITVNLLSNAIKYAPENGYIDCTAFIDNNKLSLKVTNSGKGLSSEEQKTIFERFYQTSDQNQGTGIGLALVKELVELHKGTIEVLSIPNKETAFNITLSIEKNSLQDAVILGNKNYDDTITKLPLHGETTQEQDEEFTDSDLPILLIVEDNDDLRNLLKQTFEQNYNVITASNGEIGVELALERIPDLIISDVMMPKKDGIALTSELKNDERTAHIPIILLTAKAEIESQFEGIDSGADDYITKPFDKKLLALKVEKLIESRKQLQLRYSQEVVLMPKDLAISNLDEKFLTKVQDVLQKNLVDPTFKVTEFSEAVGMSRMQLHRKLKALTGLTASEFIRSQRLKLAAELLKTSDINISEVGYSVGFNDHSYFTKCFKEVYNCTPTAFAKRN